MPMVIDTVAWVRVGHGRILCARPRGKGIFYVPGGKREGTESDLQAPLREITEELAVALLPETVTHVGTYEAGQPCGDPDGAVVRMSCYTGDYAGTMAASSEIDELAWFCYADHPRVPLSTSCSLTTSKRPANCDDAGHGQCPGRCSPRSSGAASQLVRLRRL